LEKLLLADRTATQYDWLLASSCRLSVRRSVCDTVHCGSQGWCTGLKVVPACSWQACSYLSLHFSSVFADCRLLLYAVRSAITAIAELLVIFLMELYLWNSVLDNAVPAESVNSFKSRLDNFWVYACLCI